MNNQPVSPSTKLIWTGRIISGLIILLMLFSAFMKFAKPTAVVQGMAHAGFPESFLLGLGILEIICTVIYAIPQTAVLGAILLTGYLGGAVAVSVRVGDPFLFPALVGILVWGGLFLRDRRLLHLIPLCRPSA